MQGRAYLADTSTTSSSSSSSSSSDPPSSSDEMITVPFLTSRGGAATFLGGKDDELELLLVDPIDWTVLENFIYEKTR